MYFSKLNQIFLSVSDLNISKKWYIEHFDLKEHQTGGTDNNDIVELCFESTSFWLVKHVPINKYTHIPFNFHTNKIEELHKELLMKGVTVTDITSDGECFDFYDPDGNRIGFCFESVASVDKFIEIGGTFLAVKNLSNTVQWYKEKLDYNFMFFSATGGAGVVWPTLGYKRDVTIHYANVTNKSFLDSGWRWDNIC
jgi:catechol 2,3-dioxygenase-like lactoylglutathione lyase family enzyme